MTTSLNDINEKVRALEETERVTPVKMSDLDNRIGALENTKDVFYVKYPGSGNKEYKYEIKKNKVAVLIASKIGSYETGYKHEFNIPNGYNYSGTGKNYFTLKRTGNIISLSVFKPSSFDYYLEAIFAQYD